MSIDINYIYTHTLLKRGLPEIESGSFGPKPNILPLYYNPKQDTPTSSTIYYHHKVFRPIYDQMTLLRDIQYPS